MRITRTQRRAVFRAQPRTSTRTHTRKRTRTYAAITSTLTTAALAITMAPAASADTTPAAPVTSIVTEDDGTVAVALSSTTQPLWLKLSVRASTATDAPTLFSTDDFTLGVAQDVTSAPVRLPAGTPYGDYPVDVDLRLPGGTTQHWSGTEHGAAALLDYRRHAAVTGLGYDRTSTDYDHRTVVLSGRVEALDPATGAEEAAPAGTQVRLNWTVSTAPSTSAQQTALVSTDDTGAFQLPITPGGRLYNGTATVENPSADLTAARPSVVPTVEDDATAYRITAAPSSTTVHKGSSFTVRGSVQRLTDSGWQPFAGAPVVTASAAPDVSHNTVSGQLATGTTAADGSFSYPITATRTMTVHTFLRPSPYLTAAEDSDTVHVPTAGTLTLPKYTISEFGQVTTTGRLNGDCSNQTAWLQYSPNGKSGWQNLAHTTFGYTLASYCGYTLQAYGYYDGYYRVYHAETPQMLAVSGSVHRLKRTRTSMSIAVTPARPATANSTLTATGVVTQLTSGTWKHYAKAHVVLVYRPKGDTQWYWVAKGYTNSAGRYTFHTPAYGDGTWGAYLDTDSTHFYSETKDVNIDVR